MVSIGEARQQLQSQQRQVATQIKTIEATKLPQVTRKQLARATPQTQAKYKAEIPKRQKALAQAKQQAISKVKEFEKKELGGFAKEIGKAETTQTRLNAEAQKRAQKARERAQEKAERKAAEGAYAGLSQENIEALMGDIEKRGVVGGTEELLGKAGYVLTTTPGVEQVEVKMETPDIQSSLPSWAQPSGGISDFERAIGKTFEGVPLITTAEGVMPAYEFTRMKIEPTTYEKLKGFVKERVSIDTKGIKVDLIKPQEIFGTVGGFEKWRESKEVKVAPGVPTIQELRGEQEYISPEKVKISTEDIQQKISIPFPIIGAPGGKVDLEFSPLGIGTIEKGYQEELEWGKTTGQEIIKQDKLIEVKSKELEKAETFEEQEKILGELRGGGVKVDLKTDIATGEQYYDFQTTKVPDLIYKGWREEDPTRTGFFLSALGKGYGEAGTAIAETKFQLEKGKWVSPWEKRQQELMGETYEYLPESKLVGKGAEIFGASQLYIVPGVGEAAFVTPFVERGLRSPEELKGYIKRHPYETAFAVGAIGFGVGGRVAKEVKSLRGTKSTRWVEGVPTKQSLAKSKIDISIQPKLKIIQGKSTLKFPLKTKASLGMETITPGRRYVELSKWDELFYKPVSKVSKIKKGKVILEPKSIFFKPKTVKVLEEPTRTYVTWGALAGSKGRLKAIKGGLKTQRLGTGKSERLFVSGKGKVVYFEEGKGLVPKGAGRELKKFEIKKSYEGVKFLEKSPVDETYVMLGKAKGQKVIRQPELIIDIKTKGKLIEGTVDYKPIKLGKLTETEVAGVSRKVGKKLLGEDIILDASGRKIKVGRVYDEYIGRTFAKDVTKAKPSYKIDIAADISKGKVKKIKSIDMTQTQVIPTARGKGEIIKEISYVGEKVKTKPFYKPSGEIGEEAIKTFRGGLGKKSSQEYIQTLYKDATQAQKILKEKKLAQSALASIEAKAVSKIPRLPKPKIAPPITKVDSTMLAPRMVGGEGREVSAWYGVGREGTEEFVTYTTKVGGATITTTELPQINLDVGTKPFLIKDTREDISPREDIISKARVDVISELKLLRRPKQIFETMIIPKVDIISRQEIIPQQKIIPRQLQVPRTVIIPKSPLIGISLVRTPITPRPRPPIKPISKIIPFKLSLEPKPRRRPVRKPTKSPAVFTSEVRRRGKWIVRGRFKTKKGAKAIGKRRALRTAAASFRVKKNGKVVELKPSKLFRAAKKEPGVLVQKKTKRILSAGEKREISLIGARAAKAKKAKAKKKRSKK